MKLFYFSLLCCISLHTLAQVGIGTTSPHNSAKLDISSTSQGLLPPRMITAQRDAISSPSAGLMIYNSTTNEIEFFNGSKWNSISSLIASNLPLNKLFGTTNGDEGYDIKSTPDGGLIIIGTTTFYDSGTLMDVSGYGSNDCWVLKLDAKGSIQWQKLFGGTGEDIGRFVISTTDGGYAITGNTYTNNNGTFSGTTNNGGSDAFLIKLGASGNIQWQKFFGGSNDETGSCIQQAADGGFLIAGYSLSSNTGTLTIMVIFKLRATPDLLIQVLF